MHRSSSTRARLLALVTTSFLLASSTLAADRALDFTGGCKLYQLQGKAWNEVDSAVFEGRQLMSSQILKNEKFTVFHTDEGTFGVNQKCVKTMQTTAPVPPPEPPKQHRRTSANRNQEPSNFNARGPWSASFLLGMNMSPTGTFTNTGQRTDTGSIKLKNSIAFMGEAGYRIQEHFRFVSGIGLSQLEEDGSTGNETSFFYVRPEFIFRVGTNWEVYAGPTLGLFFFSQNASTDPNTTDTSKQQTASSALLGAALGIDYAMSEQFDLGFAFQYFKPGNLKTDWTEFNAPYQRTLSVKYSMIGLRFVVHF